MSRARVPLVVVTGFLGAGKTTLVNRILARRAAGDAQIGDARGKLGVIVNELGAVGIDGDLLGGESARQVELPGGCVCCVLGDELDRTLIDLVEGNAELAAIVLETTGVAEPLPIAWAVAREPVASVVRLALVATVVDAENFVASRPVSAAVDAQVAYADVVLVTKSVLAGEQRVREAIAAVTALAPKAMVRVATTDEHAAWLEAVLADPSVEPAIDRAAPPTEPALGHTHADHPHVHDDDCRDHDTHAHGIDSVYVDITGELDLEELEDQLAELPARYVRIKGIARAVDARSGDEQHGWFAFHRVGLRVSSEPIAAPADGRARAVALGIAPSADDLARCVQSAGGST